MLNYLTFGRHDARIIFNSTSHPHALQKSDRVLLQIPVNNLAPQLYIKNLITSFTLMVFSFLQKKKKKCALYFKKCNFMFVS